MPTREDLKTMLGEFNLDEIRRTLGELEVYYQVNLAPVRPDDLRAGPAYGGPPPPLKLYRTVSEEAGKGLHQPWLLGIEDGKKIHVIKVLREHLGLGLPEANRIASGFPCLMGEFEDSQTSHVQDMLKSLRDVGATVEDRRRL